MRLGGSELKPLSPSEYEFKSFANITYPDASERAEDQRLAYLGGLMAKNGFCPGGYDVSNRRVVTTVAMSGAKDVYYTVRCK